MTGKAQSKRQTKKAKADLKEKWMQRAIEIYKEEQAQPKPRGLRKICTQAEAECLQMSDKLVKISISSLHRRVHGGQSHTEGHEGQGWLNNAETEAVLEDIIQNAARGFPPSHGRIKEHVDEIARAHHGASFPEMGVGQNWTHRFTSDHNDRIGAYWSKALDKSRARAVNPYTKDGFFTMVGDVTEGEGGDDRIPDVLKYGVDESGFQKGVGQKERVFGAKGKKTQHQQRSGDRENITVIVTICGDGTSTAPAVIFKGEGFQSSWKQDNHRSYVRLGYSKKGYTDGEIGRAWIETFHNETKAKAGGQRRLLLVDGHNSHYTRGFLEFARAHQIEVVGYPSHSTHVYQGLDIVIFGPLKHNPENIKAAFRKTGIIPFNPDVVTEEMMAPSLATSTRSTVPVQQSCVLSSGDSSEGLSVAPGPGPAPLFVRSAMGSLASTSAGFLVSPARRPSQYQKLLGEATRTAHKRILHDALLESEVRAETRKEMMTEMQAGVVLANLYTSRVQAQLHMSEQKKGKKGKKRLMGDGKAKYFSGDDFYALCVEDDQRRKDEAVAAKEKEVSKQNHVEALAAWNKMNDAIRQRNKDKKDEYSEAIATWEAERDVAKAEKRRPSWEKPKWKDWNPEKLLARPKKHAEEDDEEIEGDGEDAEMD